MMIFLEGRVLPEGRARATTDNRDCIVQHGQSFDAAEYRRRFGRHDDWFEPARLARVEAQAAALQPGEVLVVGH